MTETFFQIPAYAEISTPPSGGPGNATTNLAYLVYSLGLQQFNVGIGSAGGILAVILANIVAYFLVKMLAQNLKGRWHGKVRESDIRNRGRGGRSDHVLSVLLDGNYGFQNR